MTLIIFKFRAYIYIIIIIKIGKFMLGYYVHIVFTDENIAH